MGHASGSGLECSPTWAPIAQQRAMCKFLAGKNSAKVITATEGVGAAVRESLTGP